MLDWPAFGAALWYVNNRLGIRPEWQLAVLYLESRFDPSSVNLIGCVGLNQFCPNTYSRYVHVPIEQYREWPASAQLSGPIFEYWREALAFGPIRSSAQLMLAQLGHNLSPLASSLDNVVFRAPDNAYYRNKSFDTAGKQYITVRDIANTMSAFEHKPEVQDAIVRAYNLQGEQLSPPSVQNGPVLLVSFGLLALATAAGYGALKFRRTFA